MNPYKYATAKISRRLLIMAGVTFLAALPLSRKPGNLAKTGRLISLGDRYFAVNGWVIKEKDLA